MSPPGFTAHASVYRSRRRYRGGARSTTDGLTPSVKSCPALDCTDLDNGEYPNPEDCASFCYCVWGESVWTDCPKGLHFNAALKVCDWPQNARCVPEVTRQR